MRWKAIGCGFAASVVVSFGLVGVAWADDAATPKGAAAPAAISPTIHFTVAVPSIAAVGSSIDEATLRDILSGDVAAHADALAALNAKSIRIPEYDVSYAGKSAEGADVSGTIVFHDIRLSSVANGIANTISIAGSTLTNSEGATGNFGKITAESFDIGGLLGFYGLVKADPSGPPRTIYSNLREAQGSLKTAEGSCDVGDSSMASFKARPLKTSFPDFLKLMNEANAQGNDVSPETNGKLVAFIVDVAEAIQTSPILFAGLKCSGVDDKGKPISVNVGNVRFGAFANGQYPDIQAQKMSIVAPSEGSMSLASFLFKGIDFSNALATLKTAGPSVDEDWFQTHYRDLLPDFGGLAFSGLKVDIPDEDNPGERIQGSVGTFDLTLGSYINGVPTNVTSSATHIVAAIPDNTSDDFARQLLSIGIDKFDVGYDFALNWDEPSHEIRLSKLSLSGDRLGAVAVAAVVGNATRDLFAADMDQAANASEALTLKSVAVDMKDTGLADIIYRQLAKGAGQDVKTFRQAVAALTQGTMLIFLGGAANSEEVTKAVGDFINGAKTLSVRLTSKDPAGVTLQDFEAAQDDPTTALAKVNIEAQAK